MGTGPSHIPVLLLIATLVVAGCSPRRLALSSLADSISSGAGGVFASDDDPDAGEYEDWQVALKHVSGVISGTLYQPVT